jgi:hypothetical protein
MKGMLMSTETSPSEQYPFAPEFTQVELLERIKQASPNQALDLSDTTSSAVAAAVAQLSGQPPEASAEVVNLGNHVTIDTFWWGVQVSVDHEGMTALQAGGSATAGLLTALGVTAIVAVIIAGVIAIWSAFDRGNGVIFYVTWLGVHWFSVR